MKKILIIMLLIALGITVPAQQTIQLRSENKAECVKSDMTSLKASFSFSTIEAQEYPCERGLFSWLNLPNTVIGGNVGEPQIPVVNELIAVPVGATPRIEIKSFNAVDYNLDDYGIHKLVPRQPSLRKDKKPEDVPFVYNEAAYQTTRGFRSEPMAVVDVVGTMRGIRLGKMTIEPISYDPINNTLRVFNNIEVEIHFDGADARATEQLLVDTYSPYFDIVYKQMFNGRSILDAYSEHPDLYTTPVKMLVVTTSKYTSCDAFINWLTWKKQKGIDVDVQTVASGASSSEIRSLIQSRYNTNHPTFLVIIGDKADVTSYTTYSVPTLTHNPYDSDLQYASVDDDIYHDMYMSRMSVSSTTELGNLVNKTLTYEKYTMSDPSYLNEVLLIGGWADKWIVDSTFVDNHWVIDSTYYSITDTIIKPTIQYANTNYFNNTHGIIPQVFVSENSGQMTCYNYFGEVGFINYDGHGFIQGWSDPWLNNDYANELLSNGNSDKYFWAMGNCCLTANWGNNQYSPCFGEYLIRESNKGAFGYIGSIPETYWLEDYYFCVGATTIFREMPTMAETKKGVYDALFDDSGFNALNSVPYIGNVAVTYAHANEYDYQTSDEYYWRAYQCLGDGSVMPYLKEPSANTVSHAEALPIGASSFNVSADAGSYVAITVNNEIIGVAQVSSSGTVSVPITAQTETGTAMIVVTRNQRQPYITTIPINDGAQYVISATANPPVGGSVGGSGAYLENTQCTLTAVPNAHYAFMNWTKNGIQVSTDPTYTFTVTNDGAYVANFTQKTPYPIVALTFPTEGGTVTGSGTYYENSECTLTAIPNENYTFQYWSYANVILSHDPTYTFTVEKDRVYQFTANFAPINAHTETIGQLNYSLNDYDLTATVIGHKDGEDASGNLTIPSSVSYTDNFDNTWNYSVISIGNCAFKDCSGLTGDLVVPSSVTSIGFEAFHDCSGFTGTLTIPDAMISIGSYAFWGCSGLTGNLTIPNSVIGIGRGAFKDCSGFTGALFIPNSVICIEDYTFYGCSGLASVTIGDSVTSIGEEAFENCSGLTSVTIGNSVTIIDYSAFRNCSGLATVQWNAVNVMMFRADDYHWEAHPFYGCTNLATVVFGNSVQTIPSCAFRSCSSLNSLTLGNSVTTIGGYAFRDCSGLTGDLVIPNSVTFIGAYAFSGCNGLTGDLIIPGSVVSISPYAFKGCSGGNLIISNGVISIGEGAFYDCSGFTGTLSIGNSLTEIGYAAFENCSGFSGDLIIPNSVTFIDEYAFCDCSGFDGTLTLPNALTKISHAAFANCGFVGELVLPNTIISIELNAFKGCGGFTGNLEIPNSVTKIENGAFRNCSGFTGDLVIPNSVTIIGGTSYSFGVFDGCSGFNGNLMIGNSVTTIDNYTFQGCSGLTGELVIPNSVNYIGRYAFSGCSGLTGDLVIPNSVNYIGRYAFSGCSGLTGDLVIPNSVTTIDESTFSDCSGFDGDLSIPIYVTSIGANAFASCNNLSSIHSYNAVPPTLGNNAFNGVNTSIPVYVPSCSATDYSQAARWSNFTNYQATLSCVPTFTGNGTDDLWSNPDNWSAQPDGNYDIIICSNCEMDEDVEASSVIINNTGTLIVKPGHVLTITGNSSKSGMLEGEIVNHGTAANLIIEDGGQLVHSQNGLQGTVQKNISYYTVGGSDGWHLVTYPLVENGTVSSQSNLLSNNYDLYYYDEPTHYWRNYKDAENNFTQLEAGKGYLYANGGAETIYSFEDSNMDGWTTIDADGDGYNWGFATTPAHYGSGCIKSASYINGIGVLTPDNYIVSPQVSFTSLSKISFWACAQDANYAADHFGVAVSTTGNTNPADFTTIEEWTMTAKSTRALGNWYQYTVNLGQFAGQTGYVALRHFNCQDMYWIIVDEVGFDGFVYEDPQNIILSFAGELENGAATINLPLSYTETLGRLKGFNLVGNPFVHNVTSYAAMNVAEGCFRMNEAKDDFIVSEISEAMPLKPAEGFFVKATAEGASITFNSQTKGETKRGGFVNLELRESGHSTSSGTFLIDRLIVKREGEPLEKLTLKENSTRIFATNGNQEMAVAVAEGNEQPVNFKAAKNGTYTINVNVEGLDLDYLYLIDNLTGENVDLLVTPNYTFEARKNDYASRFRLVFSEDGGSSTGSETTFFAFISNGEIVLTNAEAGATLQIVDVMGRVVRSTDGACTVSTSGIAPGVYVLRLINGDVVRTQKIVID